MSIRLNGGGLSVPGAGRPFSWGRKEPGAHHACAGEKQHLFTPTSHLFLNKRKYLRCKRKKEGKGRRERERKEGGQAGIITWKET